MNKVIIVNLGGTAWQLEETGYDALRHYLDTAAQRLQGNPDREEILSDIECSIAEKFRPLVNNTKNVVLAWEVTRVLEEMGPIEAATGSAPAGAEGAGATSGTGARPRRPRPLPAACPGDFTAFPKGRCLPACAMVSRFMPTWIPPWCAWRSRA